ncbi:MAG: hypothetical protein Q9195_006710 [Heterodermia aff. obscurata]
MKIGGLIALSLTALFLSVILPGLLAHADRRPHPSGSQRKPKKVVENANNYRRYREYTALILCWALAILAYIAVVEHAVNNPSFMGPQDSRGRNVGIQILSFLRTGFAVIHIPLMTTVLAATVPYWTMDKFERGLDPDTTSRQPTAASGSKESSIRVTQLFYLADKSWSGLIGWISTSVLGWEEGGFSLIWALLATVAALSYAGFPLLSLTYVTTSTQYWVTTDSLAAFRVGGLSASYGSLLEATLNADSWTNLVNPTRNGLPNIELNLTGFNSSRPYTTPIGGIGDRSQKFPWADNQTILTFPTNITDDKQLPLAGIKTFALCEFNEYDAFNADTSDGSITNTIPDIEYYFDDHNINGRFAYKLRCARNCSDSHNTSAMACISRSSFLNITRFDFLSTGNGFSNVIPTFEGQALSCVHHEYDDLQSVATLVLAIQGLNVSTQVVNCNVSITYSQPTVNTLIGSYIDSTDSSTSDIVLDASPIELLNLSMAPFVNYFHEVPSQPTNLGPSQAPDMHGIINCAWLPISSGFNFWSGWIQSNTTNESQSCPSITIDTTPADLISGPYNYSFSSVTNYTFDETMFLAPLSTLIQNPAFFKTGTVAGVAFKTSLSLSYGKVPATATLLVLGIPILLTVALSVITNVQRRWTASLDAFAMFKLGSDWHDSVEKQKLVSLRKASSHMGDVPGTVHVNPETGVVKLAHAPKRRFIVFSRWRKTGDAVDATSKRPSSCESGTSNAVMPVSSETVYSPCNQRDVDVDVIAHDPETVVDTPRAL